METANDWIQKFMNKFYLEKPFGKLNSVTFFVLVKDCFWGHK
jgi:hypothetical protein